MSKHHHYCRFGHDWRVSFDARFYYCYRCGKSWYGAPGETPPQENYRRATSQFTEETQFSTHTYTQGANSMANTDAANKILGDSSGENSGNTSDAEWISVDDILYQPIVVTRANVADRYDAVYDRNRTYAYVNFYYAEDASQAPFVFRTGWPKLRQQINALLALKKAGDDPFPLECGVVEMLDRNPLVSDDGTVRFPVQLLPFEALDAAQESSVQYRLQQDARDAQDAQDAQDAPTIEPSNAPPAPHTAPRRPGVQSAPPASRAPGRSTAAPAGNGSAAAATKRVPDNLRTRGN